MLVATQFPFWQFLAQVCLWTEISESPLLLGGGVVCEGDLDGTLEVEALFTSTPSVDGSRWWWCVGAEALTQPVESARTAEGGHGADHARTLLCLR
jgi:hypothetical protein